MIRDLLGVLLLLFGLSGLWGWSPNLIDGITETPAPFQSDALSVLVVEDVSQRTVLDRGHLNLILGVPLREWCNENGVELKVWDDDVDASRADPKWTVGLNAARDSVPWLYVSDHGERGFSGPLPKSWDETRAILEGFVQ
ncbi:hypothetical protein KOR42_22900 [Thalassoglobus neptunius]|uniref:Thioredoxin domain-containing protein n=1 Tax=Thalassoglobus neptunius TaxID=1938619 RepID=A0A5C5X9B5_9PLAN|nr:hypothetical protein [Thalassoglobus neptunius]TWT58903.1 hypothetical protein KOR42_22900 [Thalassoglobus neptunius]